MPTDNLEPSRLKFKPEYACQGWVMEDQLREFSACFMLDGNGDCIFCKRRVWDR